jgi:beta-aspartyl-dipeptidase (metallo-type)
MPYLLQNADIFAPEPLGVQHVLVCGERILAILDTVPSLDPALGIEVIDLEGRRLVPGFVDGHVHVTGGGGEAGFASQVPALPLGAYTRAGVTSVVGLLGTDDVTRSVENLVARLYALRAEGLSAWAWTGGYHVPPRTLTGDVRRDVVFVEPIIGCAEIAIADHRSSQPTFDEIARLAAECHTAGLIAGKAGVLHLHLGDGARGLDLVGRALRETEVPPRVFNPTHVNRRRALFDEALDLARAGVTIDVTAFPVGEGEDAWSAADAVERYWEARLPETGLTVTSDAGGSLPDFDEQGNFLRMGVAEPGALLDTVRTLIARGHALDRVLPPFTSIPARHLRLAGKGHIAPGADADLLVLDDGGALHGVMARGTWHLRDGQPVRWGTFERSEVRSSRSET